MKEEIDRQVPVTTTESVVVYTCDRCKGRAEVPAGFTLGLDKHPLESWVVVTPFYYDPIYSIGRQRHLCGLCSANIDQVFNAQKV